jgi:hypothetical protein
VSGGGQGQGRATAGRWPMMKFPTLHLDAGKLTFRSGKPIEILLVVGTFIYARENKEQMLFR